MLSTIKYTSLCDVNVTYIGYSDRHLITRAKEHISDFKSNKNSIKNRILNCNSCLDKNPKFQLDRFSVMRKCKSVYEWKIHEAILIKKQNLTINKQIKSNPSLYALYYAEACNEFAGPISASLRPGNTASYEEM